jgi:hypothetical protein
MFFRRAGEGIGIQNPIYRFRDVGQSYLPTCQAELGQPRGSPLVIIASRLPHNPRGNSDFGSVSETVDS